MNSPEIHLSSTLCFMSLFLLIMPAAGTYAGDRPLAPVFSEQVNGDYIFVLGNGSYSL
jgi:hypothetical protein